MCFIYLCNADRISRVPAIVCSVTSEVSDFDQNFKVTTTLAQLCFTLYENIFNGSRLLHADRRGGGGGSLPQTSWNQQACFYNFPSRMQKKKYTIVSVHDEPGTNVGWSRSCTFHYVKFIYVKCWHWTPCGACETNLKLVESEGLVYNTQNYRVYGLCPSFIILITRKHNV
jgi:hypothetical protein